MSKQSVAPAFGPPPSPLRKKKTLENTAQNPLENSPQKPLEKVLRAAQGRAKAGGGPVLVHQAFPLPGAAPLAVLQALGGGSGFRFYWAKPAFGFAIAAGGAATRLTAHGEGRFRQISAALERLFQNAAGVAELPNGPTALPNITAPPGPGGAQGPLALGGFSFFDELEPGQWPGFRPAEWVIPEWMVMEQAGAGPPLGTVAAMVDGEREIDSLLAAMGQTRAALQEASRSAEGQPDGPPGLPFVPGVGENGHRKWVKMVSAATADIRAGGLAKVVLARAVELAFADLPSPFPVLHRLRKGYPDCTTFLVDPGRGQFFLGATPEPLVATEGGEVRLGALASTAARGEHEAADQALAGLLIQDRKERQEHQIVIDAIIEAVQDLGPVERPPGPQIMKLNNLQHLYTPLTLRPRQPVPLLSLVERLHPTPAVGAYPREVGLRKMRAYEDFERGWYAAPLGWMNGAGAGEFAVALRSALFGGNRVRAFAGSGILADSDPEREYQETQLKLRPILAAFANE